MYEFKYPFEPPEEDLAMEGVANNGVKWKIYDTFCKDFGLEKKAKADKEIMGIMIRARQRKFITEKMKI